MSIIPAIADRLLSSVVPQIEAGACCDLACTSVYCYCKDGEQWTKRCCPNCNCSQFTCAACQRTGTSC
jgi:hypothetical protein